MAFGRHVVAVIAHQASVRAGAAHVVGDEVRYAEQLGYADRGGDATCGAA